MSTIIVGADGSRDSLRAVEWAAEEAALREEPLRIVHAAAPWLYDRNVDPRLVSVREWLLSGGQEVLDAAVRLAKARAPGIEPDVAMVPGGASRALLEQAASGGVSMIVLGGHGVGTVAGLLLGSTALQVVAHTPVPAVVVRHLEPMRRRSASRPWPSRSRRPRCAGPACVPCTCGPTPARPGPEARRRWSTTPRR
jgi:nucleotide-binding universal stress UspA family protein